MEKVNNHPASPGEAEANVTREDESTKPSKKHYSFYLSMLMLAFVGLIVSWDATALSLALPVIANQLSGTNLQSFWASIAFVLGIAVTQPIYASISDVIGRKYMLYVSIVLFAIGTIIFSTAKNMNIIVAGRLIKGLGGGGLDVLQTIILCDITTLKERPRWLGVMSMANAIGAVTGPFLGGVLAEKVGWPWLGWVNLITICVTGFLAVGFLHLTPVEGNIRDQLRKLDWSGFALFAIIGTAIALPLSWANTLYGWGTWQTLVPLTVGVLLLGPFWFIEKRAPIPMIPYHILDNASIITGTLSGFIYGSLLNPILLYLPLFFQAVYLETPTQAAKSTLPFCTLVVAMSIIVSILIDWTRKYRVAVWIGWILTTIFLGLNYTIGVGSSRTAMYGFQALLGAGIGIAQMSTMITVLASVTRVDDEGLAAGMLVTVRFLGSLLGLAMCSTVFTSVFQHSLSSIKPLPEQIQTLYDASQAVGFIPRLREIHISEEIIHGVGKIYEESFHTIWIVLAAFSGVAVLISIWTRENSLEAEDVGRQGFKAPPLKTTGQ